MRSPPAWGEVIMRGSEDHLCGLGSRCGVEGPNKPQDLNEPALLLCTQIPLPRPHDGTLARPRNTP